MLFSKPQISFFSNFASLFSAMKITHLYFFNSNIYFAQKEPIKVKIFENFTSLFSVMRHNSSAFFSLKFYIFSTKRAYQITNLVKFHVSSKKSEILHFDGLLLSKSYTVSAKKVQQNDLFWHWRVKQSLKKNWLAVSTTTWGIWWIFTQPLKSLKISLWWAPLVQST